MTSFNYKIYPPLGVARVGNGPANIDTAIFTPEVPWQHFYDTDVEYLVTENDLKQLVDSQSITSVLNVLRLEQNVKNELSKLLLGSTLSQLMDHTEIIRFVDDIDFKGTQENCEDQFREACISALKEKYLGAVKKQAQRFHIYKFDQDGNCCGKLPLSEVESLTWHVEVGNKKAFWYDYNNALDLSLDQTNGNLSDTVAKGQVAPGLMAKQRNPNVVGNHYRRQLVIHSQGSVDMASDHPTILTGKFPANVNPGEQRLTDLFQIEKRHNVKQGSIEFDHQDGALIFYAGDGISKSLTASDLNTDFADNSNWYDDICDGRVTAELVLKNSDQKISLTQAQDSAWIATAPADFAPQIEPLVTLYDMVTGASYDQNAIDNLETQFSDVFPILYRLYRMQWVNQADFADNSLNVELANIDFTRLLNSSQEELCLRENIFKRFRNPVYSEGEEIALGKNGELISKSRLIPSQDTTSIKPTPTPAELQLPYYPGDGVDYPGSPLQWFAIPPFMYKHLQNWAEGHFTVTEQEKLHAETIDSLAKYYSSQFEQSEHSALLSARAAMDSLYGGGFHPGVELTWPMRRAQMYAKNEFISGVTEDINLLGLREFRINAAENNDDIYNDFGRVITAQNVTQSVNGDPKAHWLWTSTPGDLTKWMGIPWQSDAASCQAVYTAQDFPIPAWWAANLPVTIIPAARYESFKHGFNGESKLDPTSHAALRETQFASRQPWLQTANTGFVGYHAQGGYTLGLVAMVDQWKNMGMVMARPGTVSGENNSPGIPEVVYVSYGVNDKSDI